MTKLTGIDGTDFEACKIYGIEERDSDSVNILVENELINNRLMLTRTEQKEMNPRIDDYLLIRAYKDGLPTDISFVDSATLSSMITEVPVEVVTVAPVVPEIVEPVVETPVPSEPVVPPSVEEPVVAMVVAEEAVDESPVPVHSIVEPEPEDNETGDLFAEPIAESLADESVPADEQSSEETELKTEE